MAFQEGEIQEKHRLLSSAALVFDGLYCEESFEEDYNEASDICDDNVRNESSFSFVLLEQDLSWEDSELLSLISKEKDTFLSSDNVASDGSLMVARKEAIEWILKFKSHYGFTALTGVLAVNYFDRFISSLKFQRDKPWMGHLTAVACFSLAAKVEETQEPLLLDLQVEDSKANTIKRMELLVLSTLQWRMNPVTPISFFDHIIRRLVLKTNLHWEFLLRCERLLLSVIVDSRFMSYLPSILAAAVMLHVIKEVEPCNQVDYQNQLMSVLKISENDVNECYNLILELLGTGNQSQKRKCLSAPSSPNGVIDASFSCDSSNDSWAMASSMSSSPVTRFKRSRAQDQQMQLPSLNQTEDLLTELPAKQAPWSILDKLKGPADVLPKFVGYANSNGNVLQWQASCFKTSQASLKFTSNGGTLKLKLANPDNFWCGDVYLFATPYQFKMDYYIKRGDKQLEFEWEDQADYDYVKKNGIPILIFQEGMWSTVAELAQLYPLYQDSEEGEQANIDFLKTHMGTTFHLRPKASWVSNINPDDIQSGDFLALSKIRGSAGIFETLEKWVTGAGAGHAAVCLRDPQGKLWVGESGRVNEQGLDIIGIIQWEDWWEFERTKDPASPHIALLPLHHDV